MAIVTVAEVKEILQISVSTYDTLIGILIPQAEGLYEDIRGIPFFAIVGDATISTKIIDDVTDADMAIIEKNETIESLADDGTIIRGLVTYVNIDDNEISVENDATASADDIDFKIYPKGSKYVASKIIGYLLEKDSSTGYKSESIGNYSYDKFDSVTGLPLDIVGMIVQYQTGWR